MKNILIWSKSLVLMLVLFACSSDDAPLSKDKVLQTFSILKSENSEKIAADCEGVISGQSIVLELDKYDCLQGLVPTFSYLGENLNVDGVTVKSGETELDFSEPFMLTVVAQDGSRRNYEVSVSLKESTPMTRFAFLKSLNKDMLSDKECTLSGTDVLAFFSNPPSTLIPTFETSAKSVKVNGVEQVSGVTPQDFSKPVVYELDMMNGETVSCKVKLDYVLSGIPQFNITTEDASITEIPSKDYYVNATLEVDGAGIYDDYTGTTEIKGRGNSTWGMPKKPYRLKLNKKASLCGFGTAKNYVLLANHIDPTLMLNAVAFKIAHLLDMPFTNHVIPVDVTLNGVYKGSYMLTEQVEVKENRIDLDEDNCIVWELDTNYDEDYKFHSDQFNLPVMVKDPDLTDEQFAYWKNDFNTFLNAFAQEPLAGSSYVDMIDIESVAKYLLVYNLTHNMEINHPKSIYLHKEGNGKYVMGPVWDFDWAFDYEGTNYHFGSFSRSLWNQNMTNGAGCRFFQRFLNDPRVAKLYQDIWMDFYTNKMGLLLDYVEAYAEVLKPSVERNSELWSNTKNFESRVNALKQWLKNRADYLDSLK